MSDEGSNAVAAATSSILDFTGNNIMMNSANAKSKRQALTSFIWQNYLMDKQNEYNKPINQMARYAEAGLNPMLIYGEQNLSAGAPSAPEAAVHASRGELDFMQKFAAAQQIKQSEAQSALYASQAEKNVNDVDMSRGALFIKAQLAAAQIRNLISGAKLRESELERWNYVAKLIEDIFNPGENTTESSTETAGKGKVAGDFLKGLSNIFTLSIKNK